MYSLLRSQLQARTFAALRACGSRPFRMASLHTSAAALELTKFTMPAMSPTMQDGGIASWHKKEGESYAAGEVLLEIVRV